MGRLAGLEAVEALGDEAYVTTCHPRRMFLFLCHAATMVKPIHPFTKLSPEERQKEITPGDVWPVSSISFDREKGEMVMAIRHHASATDMLKVPGSRELLGSAALWWASLTEKLYPHVFHHCVPFRMTIVRGLMEMAEMAFLGETTATRVRRAADPGGGDNVDG